MPRGSEVQISHKTSEKGLKNIQTSIAELSHLAAAPTWRIIVPHATYQILDLFGLSKLAPPDKNSLYFHYIIFIHYIRGGPIAWCSLAYEVE